jgi:broad specificity phosphatase PhoE
MAIKLLLIRHGESEANVHHKFSGFQDVKLTERGIWQAKRLANRLKAIKIDKIYCSTLNRAKHTAEIVFKNKKNFITSKPGLKEMNFGIWEGLTFEQVKSKYGFSNNFFSWPININIESSIQKGESITQLNERVMNAFNKILLKHQASEKDETIAFVCHGGTNRVILINALNMKLHRMWYMAQDSTALNIIYYNNGSAFVKAMNDISHLEDWWENDIK